MKQDAPVDGLERLRISKSQRPVSTGRSGLTITAIVALVAGVGAGGAWWYYKTTGVNIVAAMSEKPVAVRMYTLPRQAAEQAGEVVLVASGKIVSDVLVNVATKVSGQITSLHVEQGDYVDKDQVLARIEVDVYEAQRDEVLATVEQLKHSIDRAKADYDRQLAAIEESQADHDWRKYSYERLQRLGRGDHASDVELVEARYALDAAAAALAVAKATAESTRNSIKVIEAEQQGAESLQRLWQKRLDDCAIRAPIAGVILERNAQVGDFLAAEGGRGANANAQLVSIADMTRLRVEIDISERDIHRIIPGQKARITPDAYKSDVFDGYVMWIDPIGDYARAVVQVKVRIENPSPLLRIDGSAKVEFIATAEESTPTDSKRNWLPLATVKIPPGEGDALVFTVINGRAVANVVELGARTDKMAEVTSGVYPGMEIIADHLEDIMDGTLVVPQGVLTP